MFRSERVEFFVAALWVAEESSVQAEVETVRPFLPPGPTSLGPSRGRFEGRTLISSEASTRGWPCGALTFHMHASRHHICLQVSLAHICACFDFFVYVSRIFGESSLIC